MAGINHGTAVGYSNAMDVEELSKFVEQLHSPSFESITYKQLRNTAKTLKNGEPIYLVLYKNYEIASHYFNDMAQQFKFKAKIFKSNDPAMFDAAGFTQKTSQILRLSKIRQTTTKWHICWFTKLNILPIPSFSGPWKTK